MEKVSKISFNSARRLLTKGIFAVDKPKNVYSMKVIDKLKENLEEDLFRHKEAESDFLKIGHGGILDFSATGVLVIGVGEGCRRLPLYLKGDKKYVAIGKLGDETDTFNDTGKITGSAPYDHISKAMIDTALKSKFVGSIWQVPPKYSALKRKGRRVSDLVLEGQEVEMQPRRVDCHSATCFLFDPPHFHLEITCGGGFYVRSLVHDLGKVLGSCAHVTELRRTQQGVFTESDALKEADWNASNILKAIKSSKIYLKKKDEWYRIRND
ncbi:pseudouridylate synthase TRUB1-like [Cloeon dipterum]|uniref:pseudouridylate synthase TRUB1-like n=1 Tax=Cloeon dipterum TaxID=197152 RepID=UPI00322013A1